ncbi:zincin [Laetiporus sulphureus 93-53]|uniref:Zincin n=1 Tax=Laetiporus sulphureus 93-53 TaxID=1314785 RepID=A0A165F6D4_9APHY|nr:zincin [Laetiporus sulphureus 93-53]KZT08480.1 zincin [Laetiporus sulphureus 93-53]
MNSTGLFNYPSLSTPLAFNALADSTLRRAQLLTERVPRARGSRSELFKVVKNLDTLSDLLCGVIDLAELLRNAHPDRAWVRCADGEYEKLCEFMNILNTHVGLHEVLHAVLSDREVVKSLTPEDHQTALMFWRDFEKSGIDLLPGAAKQGIKDMGMGARLRLQAQFTQRHLLAHSGSLQAQMIMRSAPAEEPRRKLYMAANASTPEHIETLEKLLHARGENVQRFLDALMDYTRPYARSALRTLSIRKQAHLNTAPFRMVQAWDCDYYHPPEPPAPPAKLPPLTLGRVFMGLSRLFQNLYGVSLRLSDGTPGEAPGPDFGSYHPRCDGARSGQRKGQTTH